MKKKLMLVAPNLKVGGAESVLVKIINNIDYSKYDIKLVLFNKEGDLLKRIEPQIEIIDLKKKNFLVALYRLKKVISNNKPEIIFSIIGHINVMLSFLKFFFFKDIFFIGRENAVYKEWKYEEKKLKRLIVRVSNKIFLKRLDVIIVQSEFMKKQIIDFFNVDPKIIKIFNNPIEFDKISELSHEFNSQEFRDDSSMINLLAVGRLEEIKNYKDMIYVVSKLPENYKLTVLGEGSQKEYLEKYIVQLDVSKKIELKGYSDNPYIYMKQSDLFLLTSEMESFPNVVLEANACGTYAISYNMPGGISEIIEEDLNGNLIEYGNKNKMIQKILDINHRTIDSEKIIEHSKQFSMDQYIKKLEKLLDTNRNN